MLRNTDFLEAIKLGDFNQVKEMLDNGVVNVNAMDEFKRSALMLAASYGHIGIVKLLCERNADLHAKSITHETPIISTINLCSPIHKEAIVRFLVEKGANINDQDFTDATPLIWAVMQADEKIVEFLLEQGADVNAMAFQGNALIVAITNNQKKILSLLLAKGANIFAKDKHGNHALTWAIILKRDEMIPLLERGCVKNLPENSFQSRLEKIPYKGEIPSEFICPISRGIMNDPLTVSSGATYDRQSLIDWVASNNDPQAMQCPLTSKSIFFEELQNGTNITIKNQLERFVSKREVGENKKVRPAVEHKEKKRIGHSSRLFPRKEKTQQNYSSAQNLNLKH